MIFNSPSSTRFMSAFPSNKLDVALKAYIINSVRGRAISQIVKPVNGMQFVFLLDSESAKEVPAFAQPRIVMVEGSSYAAVDVRAYVRKSADGRDTIDGTWKVSNDHEYTHSYLEAALLNVWMDSPGSLRDTNGFPTYVFATVIGDTLSRTLMLDMRKRDMVIAMAMIYFQSLYYINVGDAELNRIIARTAAVARIPETSSLRVLGDTNSINGGVGELVRLIKLVDPIAFASIDETYIYSMFSNIWYGAAARERVLTALEYPPALHAILFVAMSSKAMKNTAFAKTAEALKRFDQTNFVGATKRIVDTISAADSDWVRLFMKTH